MGNELASQFKQATNRVPNQEYTSFLLEHSGGFERIISLLTKVDPQHMGELAIVIRDVELASIRALPTSSRNERGLVERKMECLIGTIVAAVEIGQGLKRNPDVSIYIWDEFGKGSTHLSEKLSDSLTSFFRDTIRAKVLSQFQRDENGMIGTLKWKPSGSTGMPISLRPNINLRPNAGALFSTLFVGPRLCVARDCPVR